MRRKASCDKNFGCIKNSNRIHPSTVFPKSPSSRTTWHFITNSWVAGSARNAAREAVERLILGPFFRELEGKVRYEPVGYRMKNMARFEPESFRKCGVLKALGGEWDELMEILEVAT